MPTIRQRLSAALKAFNGPAPSVRFPRPISMRAVAAAQQRSYAGAQYDRLVEDWRSPLTTGDAEMRTRLRTLRGRARELERNEPYTMRYLSRLEDNVYDHHGMTFNSLAGEWRLSKDKKLSWVIDQLDAQYIEAAYNEWKKNPFVTGDMSLNEGGRLALRSAARDGDLVIKRVVDKSLNDFGFGLQLLEADMVDDYKNEVIRSPASGYSGAGMSEVRMGVQVNGYMKPEGFWILKAHPGDQMWWTTDGYQSDFHPAENFIHPFRRSRITQVRDVTWLHGIMRDLKMLDGYDEAAIVAARTGAAKMGFIVRDYNEPGDPYTGPRAQANGEGGDGGTGDQGPGIGDMRMDADPGLIEDFSQNPGLRFEKWDPAYPHEQYDSFVKTRLRRIGAGLDMSYYAIANDLTEVNFSSIRAGLLEDREHFKALQTWWIYHFETPVFLWWLEMSLLTGSIKDPISGRALPFSQIKKFAKHKFQPRRWGWVDPEKDVKADILAIDNRLTTRDSVIQENGQSSFREVAEGQKREQEIADQNGVELPPVANKMPEPQEPDGDEGGGGKDDKKKPADGKKRTPEAVMVNIHTAAAPVAKPEYDFSRDDEGRLLVKRVKN